MNLIVLLCWVFSAFAGTAALAGIPLDKLAGLGLGEPVFVDGADQWKAAAAGGFVTAMIEADAVAAEERFVFQRATVGVQLPELTLAGADQAAGDEGLVLARRANIVFVVRGHLAVAVAEQLLLAVQAAPPSPRVLVPGVPASPLTPGVEARDLFGRRIP